MKYRNFGDTDIRVSALGLGGASLGSRVGGKQARRILEESFDAGITFYDTAPLYGEGDSESLIGRTFESCRDRVVISTKVGWLPNRMLRLVKPVKGMVRSLLKSVNSRSLQRHAQKFIRSNNRIDLSEEAMNASVDSSLRRLRTDYIDLLLIHKTPDRALIPEIIESLQRLRRSGKVRYFGVSPQTIDELRDWLRLECPGLAALQVEVNALNYFRVHSELMMAHDRKIAIVAREVYAQGRLISRNGAGGGTLGFVGEGYDRRFEFLSTPGSSVEQGALKLVMQHPAVSTVLVGMSSHEHLIQNLASVSQPPLSEVQLQRIRNIDGPETVSRLRHSLDS